MKSSCVGKILLLPIMLFACGNKFEWDGKTLGGSQGCFLELGGFPLAYPMQEDVSFYYGLQLSEFEENTGKPKNRLLGELELSRELGEYQRTVAFEYNGYSVELSCSNQNLDCWLTSFHLTDSKFDLGCGLHIGSTLKEFVQAKGMEHYRKSSNWPKNKKIEFHWSVIWNSGLAASARRATIVLHQGQSDNVGQISWHYYAD